MSEVDVTVVDPLDDGLNFWGLDQVKQLELDGDHQEVSSAVILLRRDGGQEVLVIHGLDEV